MTNRQTLLAQIKIFFDTKLERPLTFSSISEARLASVRFITKVSASRSIEGLRSKHAP